MAQFVREDCEEILRLLGYTVPYDRLIRDNLQNTEFTETVIDRALEIFKLLKDVDQQLVDLLPDSMAVVVGELKLSYPQHKRLLKDQASEWLAELANLVGMPIRNDKYRSSVGTVSYW